MDYKVRFKMEQIYSTSTHVEHKKCKKYEYEFMTICTCIDYDTHILF